jgi:tRNA G26 N,N-dimethylase Trm1
MITSLLCPRCGSTIKFREPVEPGSTAGLCERCLAVLHYTGPIWAEVLTAATCPLRMLKIQQRLEAQAKAIRHRQNGGRIIL